MAPSSMAAENPGPTVLKLGTPQEGPPHPTQHPFTVEFLQLWTILFIPINSSSPCIVNFKKVWEHLLQA